MIACAARDVLLVYPAQPHGAPFVMVPRKPQLPDVRKLCVRFYLVLIEVAVVVDDGQVFDLSVYFLRACAVYKQLFSVKFLHFYFVPPYDMELSIRMSLPLFPLEDAICFFSSS